MLNNLRCISSTEQTEKLHILDIALSLPPLSLCKRKGKWESAHWRENVA